MAEPQQEQATQPQAQPTVVTVEKKGGKGICFWLGLIGCGCLLLFGCVLGGLGILCVTSDDFKEEFEKSYCESLEEQGVDPAEDPLGICK